VRERIGEKKGKKRKGQMKGEERGGKSLTPSSKNSGYYLGEYSSGLNALPAI